MGLGVPEALEMAVSVSEAELTATPVWISKKELNDVVGVEDCVDGNLGQVLSVEILLGEAGEGWTRVRMRDDYILYRPHSQL